MNKGLRKQGTGWRDVEGKEEVEKQTSFFISQMTKGKPVLMTGQQPGKAN